jgi:pimeloyl-ACP methyl ester carboxylesterase
MDGRLSVEIWETSTVAQPSQDSQFVTTPDGRELCFADCGRPGDFPVLFLHGTPGGRLNRHPDDRVYVDAGVRLITYDRPGYGRSSRQPGRSVVDCVADVEALLDHVGVDRFSVTGSSGGGPHVLAVAARLGDRVVRARCNVGLAPYGAAGLDFFDGMDPLNVVEFGWALEGESRLAPELERQLTDLAERMDADATQLLSDEWNLEESDRAVLAEAAAAAQNRAMTRELVRGGAGGWIDDSLAFVNPWGFDVAEIDVPVRVTYGVKDVVVPAAHGAWLGRHVPGAEIIVDRDAGHLSGLDQVSPSMRWLATGSSAT